ncbi:MAG: restriction endonuclease subunit S [Alphaproteobacteria bacterium]|nr:restriction endonuclease subunit S [Alphaproteobacteria bacterium]
MTREINPSFMRGEMGVAGPIVPAVRWAALGDECQIVGGGTPSRIEPAYFGGDIPWATPTDVTGMKNGMFLHQTKETITNEGLEKSSAKLLPKGTVLLTSRATIGFTAIADVPMATNQGFANFICGPNVLPEYLAHWLPIQRNNMLQLAGGTTFKEISKGTLKQMCFPVPPLPEQRRIVDILNHAASIRRLRDEARAKAREIIPALFVEGSIRKSY